MPVSKATPAAKKKAISSIKTAVDNKPAAKKSASKPAAKAASSKAASKTNGEKLKPAKAASENNKAAKGKTATPITPEQRYRMICDAAYFRAERRGFIGGNPADDWTAAEAEIDSLLLSMRH